MTTEHEAFLRDHYKQNAREDELEEQSRRRHEAAYGPPQEESNEQNDKED